MVTTLQPATPGASARQARLGQGGSVLAENRLLRRGYERRPATPEQAPDRPRERRTGTRRRGTTLAPLGNTLLPTWFPLKPNSLRVKSLHFEIYKKSDLFCNQLR